MYTFAYYYLFCLLSTAIIYGSDDPSSHIVKPGYNWKVLEKREFTKPTPSLNRTQSSPNLFKGKKSAPKQIKTYSPEEPPREFEKNVSSPSKQVKFHFPEKSSSEEEYISDEE
jgi:hypothetical protein